MNTILIGLIIQEENETHLIDRLLIAVHRRRARRRKALICLSDCKAILYLKSVRNVSSQGEEGGARSPGLLIGFGFDLPVRVRVKPQ